MLVKVMWLAPPGGRIVRESQAAHEDRQLTHQDVRESPVPTQDRSLTHLRHREPQGPTRDRQLTDHRAEPVARPTHSSVQSIGDVSPGTAEPLHGPRRP